MSKTVKIHIVSIFNKDRCYCGLMSHYGISNIEQLNRRIEWAKRDVGKDCEVCNTCQSNETSMYFRGKIKHHDIKAGNFQKICDEARYPVIMIDEGNKITSVTTEQRVREIFKEMAAKEIDRPEFPIAELEAELRKLQAEYDEAVSFFYDGQKHLESLGDNIYNLGRIIESGK